MRANGRVLGDGLPIRIRKGTELFEEKQVALDLLLTDLEEAKEQAGFWSILRITELIAKMRSLLRGGASSHG